MSIKINNSRTNAKLTTHTRHPHGSYSKTDSAHALIALAAGTTKHRKGLQTDRKQGFC